MRELSVFVDESGNLGDDAKYYLLALVLHDQSKDVFEHIGRYESTLAQRGLRGPGLCQQKRPDARLRP